MLSLLTILLACGGVRDRAQALELTVSHIESPTEKWVAGKSVSGDKWVVEILGRDRVVYRDEPGPLGRFQVYWAWDDQDRLWMYDSDDGSMRWWHRADGSWQRQPWDFDWEDRAAARFLCGLEPKSPTPAPPAVMFPFKLTSSARSRLSEVAEGACAEPDWIY